MKKHILFLSLAALISTIAFADDGWMPTTIVKGPDWRLFEVYSKALPYDQIQKACNQVDLAIKKDGGAAFVGCAQISFALGTCHYLYETGNDEAHEHERRHCAGLDHLNPAYVSEINMQETWNHYQQQIREATQTLVKGGLSKSKAHKKAIEISEKQAIKKLQQYRLPVTPLEAKEQGWTYEENNPIWYKSK